jgi:hypothetical protein
MVTHMCPICGRIHDVRQARAEVAYGRRLTCSPECESERRRRRCHRPFRPLVAEPSIAWWQRLRESSARVLHVWVLARTHADLLLAAQHMPRRVSRES